MIPFSHFSGFIHGPAPTHGLSPFTTPQPSSTPPVRGLLTLTPENSTSASWPIPESFWLDRSQEHLPRREAQPTLLYRRLGADSDDPAVTSVQVCVCVHLGLHLMPLLRMTARPARLYLIIKPLVLHAPSPLRRPWPRTA